MNLDEGMCLKSLYANGQLLSENEEGKYLLQKLSEPVVLSAEFVEATGVKNTESDKFEIVPNWVDGYLLLNNMADMGFERYTIVDMSGKAMQEGAFTEKIDVSHLQSGKYLIELKGKKFTKTGEFIKK